MAKVFIVAHLPDGLERALLQHIRDFDVAHPGSHFEIMADAPDMTLQQIIDMVRVDPALTFTQVLERKKQ